MNTLEQDKKIIANAPEGATGCYWDGQWWIKEENGICYFWSKLREQWDIANFSDLDNIRALSDIKQIIAQAERIAELEDLRKMILDAESADASLIPFMYQTWLHKAKQAEAL